MAIDAVDFDGRTGLAINLSIAVIVLAEMAIGALHSPFKMDVGKVNSFINTVNGYVNSQWRRIEREKSPAIYWLWIAAYGLGTVTGLAGGIAKLLGLPPLISN